MEGKEIMCVTGAGGYQASWLVNLLLSKGFVVHGTVRDPNDEKNAHLKALDNASENLRLFKADLLDYEALYAAIEGCIGVFHVASPVPSGTVAIINPEVEVVEPAVRGTSNILKACSEAGVKKVVVVSSAIAIALNPKWPKEQVMDESCWSDKEFCKLTGGWYYLSKVEAESLALEYGKTTGLNVVTICPTIIIGPMLQPTTNASSMILIRMMKDGLETLRDRFRVFVDVRDMAEALLLLYEKPEAEGRYICSSHTVPIQDVVDKLKSLYPNYNYPKEVTGGDEHHYSLSSEKLKKLGWKYRPFEETLVDSVKNYQERGILAKMY